MQATVVGDYLRRYLNLNKAPICHKGGSVRSDVASAKGMEGIRSLFSRFAALKDDLFFLFAVICHRI